MASLVKARTDLNKNCLCVHNLSHRAVRFPRKPTIAGRIKYSWPDEVPFGITKKEVEGMLMPYEFGRNIWDASQKFST